MEQLFNNLGISNALSEDQFFLPLISNSFDITFSAAVV